MTLCRHRMTRSKEKIFSAKSLNVYTNSLKAYFDIDEFRKSDRTYHWTLDQLAKLPIDWYGGADLSKLHDLTAVALFWQLSGSGYYYPPCVFPSGSGTSESGSG